LLFERMEGGWVGFPEELEAFEFLIFQWYSLLKEGGVMFVQSPYVLEQKNIEDWINWLDSNKSKLNKEILDYVFEGQRFYLKIQKDFQKQPRFIL
ncbi:MAG: hypothetical protein N2Z85_03015, partial [Patescibacteria group bacterium]|nr:hypothetical protein [Patescibacteria group bacterium]